MWILSKTGFDFFFKGALAALLEMTCITQLKPEI